MNNKVSSGMLLVTIAALTVISLGQDIFVPIILGAFLAMLCTPIVNILSSTKIPRALSIVITFGAVMCVGIILIGITSSAAADFVKNSKTYTSQFEGFITSKPYLMDSLGLTSLELSDLTGMLSPAAAMSYISNALFSLREVFSKVFFVSLISVFMLIESNLFAQKLLVLCGDRKDMIEKASDFTKSLKHYILIKTGTSAATGLIISLLLWAMDTEYAILFGVIAFALNYIPTIGSIIAALPAVALALVGDGLFDAGLVALIYLVTNIIIGSMIEPKILGRGLGISPTFVILSLVFWGWILGFAGMFLSIPLTVMIKIACQNSESWHFLSVILSDKASYRKSADTAKN